MFVGADAYIGPLGSCEIAGDSRTIGIFCGRTESSAPTEYGGAAKPCCRGRRLCRPVWVVTNSPKSSVKTDCSARADVGIGPYNQMRTYLRIRRRFPKIRCVLPGGAAPPLPELCVCKKNALSFHTQGEEDLRGTTCIPACAGTRSSVTGGPGGAYCAFSPAARRRRELRLCGSLHQPLPLCGAARSSFLFSACIGMGN